MKQMDMPLAAIKIDLKLQLRTLCLDTQAAYAELMKEGVPFSPVGLCYDGKAYWLWDGFHRVFAAKEAGLKRLIANVYEGTKRDAERMALGCNENGLNRDKATKMAVVERIEADAEWKLLTIDEKVKLSSMSRRWYLKLKSELETPDVQTSAQVHQSGTEDSTIPEPENETDSALKPTPSAKIEGKAFVTDSVGNNVPDNLRDIFLRQQEIKDYINRLDKLKSDTKEAIRADPALWTFFRQNPFQVELANVRRQYRFAVPHALCPYCSGIDSQDCKLCRGAGFLNEETLLAVPAELK